MEITAADIAREYCYLPFGLFCLKTSFGVVLGAGIVVLYEAVRSKIWKKEVKHDEFTK